MSSDEEIDLNILSAKKKNQSKPISNIRNSKVNQMKKLKSVKNKKKDTNLASESAKSESETDKTKEKNQKLNDPQLQFSITLSDDDNAESELKKSNVANDSPLQTSPKDSDSKNKSSHGFIFTSSSEGLKSPKKENKVEFDSSSLKNNVNSNNTNNDIMSSSNFSDRNFIWMDLMDSNPTKNKYPKGDNKQNLPQTHIVTYTPPQSPQGQGTPRKFDWSHYSLTFEATSRKFQNSGSGHSTPKYGRRTYFSAQRPNMKRRFSSHNAPKTASIKRKLANIILSDDEYDDVYDNYGGAYNDYSYSSDDDSDFFYRRYSNRRNRPHHRSIRRSRSVDNQRRYGQENLSDSFVRNERSSDIPGTKGVTPTYKRHVPSSVSGDTRDQNFLTPNYVSANNSSKRRPSSVNRSSSKTHHHSHYQVSSQEAITSENYVKPKLRPSGLHEQAYNRIHHNLRQSNDNDQEVPRERNRVKVRVRKERSPNPDQNIQLPNDTNNETQPQLQRRRVRKRVEVDQNNDQVKMKSTSEKRSSSVKTPAHHYDSDTAIQIQQPKRSSSIHRPIRAASHRNIDRFSKLNKDEDEISSTSLAAPLTPTGLTRRPTRSSGPNTPETSSGSKNVNVIVVVDKDASLTPKIIRNLVQDAATNDDFSKPIIRAHNKANVKTLSMSFDSDASHVKDPANRRFGNQSRSLNRSSSKRQNSVKPSTTNKPKMHNVGVDASPKQSPLPTNVSNPKPEKEQNLINKITNEPKKKKRSESVKITSQRKKSDNSPDAGYVTKYLSGQLDSALLQCFSGQQSPQINSKSKRSRFDFVKLFDKAERELQAENDHS